MKSIILRCRKFSKPASLLCGMLALGAAGLFAADQQLQVREAREPADHVLEGAWDIVITTTPTPPFAAPFRILRTVTPTGVTDAYAFPSITPTVPRGIPLSNSSGHGNWAVLDTNLFTVTVKYFQLNTALLNVLDSVGEVRENIRMGADGNSYTSVFETTITLANGATIVNKGQTVATRIKVVPLTSLP